ncbi:MAG: amidohydrolase [Bacillota bacterium]
MLAITNGKILTITKGTIDKGTVLIDDKGKIAAVGADVEVPKGAKVINARGKWVTPGLIDAHSHVAIFGEPMIWAHDDGNEMTDPNTAQLRAVDAINPEDPAIPDARSAGFTTLYTGPGSANVIGGTGIAIKLRGRTIEEMAIPGTEGMKMALGENPKNVYGQMQKKYPATRMGNAAVLRESLVKAQNYLKNIERAKAEAAEKKEKPKLPDRDLKMEALGKVLRREMKARIHCHRADDIMTAVRIAEEFNLDYVIEHCTEGYKIADYLGKKKVRATIGPLFLERFKMELRDITLKNPGICAKAGVKVALQADTFSGTRFLPIHVGTIIREGMDEEEAFRAVTINSAEILGLQKRLGSIEKGKDGDIAIFDGHPFSNFTNCLYTIIDGEVVYEHE